MKGQAALEFLTTYGWAILVVLIALGALSSMFVFKFGVLYPNSCFIEPGMACQEYGGSGNELYFEIINTMGKDLSNVNLTIITGACDNSPISKQYNTIKANKAVLNNTETGITTIPCTRNSDRIVGTIIVNYKATTEDLDHELKGDFNFFVK